MTQTNPEVSALPTQADRDAAFSLMIGEKVGAGDGNTYVGRRPSIREVEFAFARHRLAHQTPPATQPIATVRAVERIFREGYRQGHGDGSSGYSTEDEAWLAFDRCSDCSPVGYSTDSTRCSPCPRRATVGRYYALPFTFHEPAGHSDPAYIRDANGQAVAMMMWPGHEPQDEDEAAAETYAIGRAFAATLHTPPPVATATVVDAGEIVGWAYDLAMAIGTDGYSDFRPRISYSKPEVPPEAIRNLRALAATPTPPAGGQ